MLLSIQRAILSLAFFPISYLVIGQCSCECRNQREMSDYLTAIEEKFIHSNTCPKCDPDPCETILIYDAKCKKLLYKLPHGPLSVLQNLSDLRLRYKQPFRIKVLNFNRYLYNLNMGNSDVIYTSSQPQVMQQYLFPGMVNGQITPPNTYTNGTSQNSGDYVFSAIAGFKSSIDVIVSKINSAVLPLQATDEMNSIMQRIKTALGKLPAGDSTAQHALKLTDSVRKKSQFLTMNQGDTATFNIQLFFVQRLLDSTFKALRNYSDSINGGNVKPKQAADTGNIKKQLDTVRNYIFNDTILFHKRDTVRYHADSLRYLFLKLSEYCNSFIDNRIKAYSLCTIDTLGCCNGRKMYTYQEFDEKLNKISQQLNNVKYAWNVYDSLVDRAKAADSSNKSKKAKDQDTQSSKPTLHMDITEMDFKNGQLTGVKMLPTPEKAKEKKEEASDPFDLIDSLWFAFERSIPADYIMRQILFRNNLIDANMSYTSPPIFPYGDHLGMFLQITPSDSVSRMGIMPINADVMSLDFTVVGRPQFCFSGGTFAGIWLKSTPYEWQQVPVLGTNLVQPNSPYQLVKSGSGNVPVGVIGLANVTVPWPSSWLPHCKTLQNTVRLGLSGGVGLVVDPSPVQVAYILGPTMSIGTHQQFHFTIGVAAMNVNEKKSSLSSQVLYSSQPSIGIYNQHMQGGGFVSVTYTLFTPKNTGTVPSGLPTTASGSGK